MSPVKTFTNRFLLNPDEVESNNIQNIE
jgi:phosphoketolase